MSRKTKFATAAAVMVLIVAYFFAYSWTIEWDTRTGMQRTVHYVAGLRIIAGNSKSTKLSEWLRGSDEPEQWMKVAAGSNDGALVSYCYPRILWHLRSLDWFIREDTQRHHYASWILSEIAAGRPICDLRRHCDKVEDSIRRLDHDFEQEPLKTEVLRALWEESK